MEIVYMDIEEDLQEEKEVTDAIINRLPVSLLSLIISRLPIEEAVRTDAVSRRWKHLWRWIMHIDFDSFTEKRYSLDQVSRIINCVFSLHCGNICSCRITHYLSHNKNGDVKGWIEHLRDRRRRIQELALTCVDDPHDLGDLLFLPVIIEQEQISNDLPPGIFGCQSLRVLELNKYFLRDASPFENCANLQTLNLQSVCLSDDTLNKIISNCVALENLILSKCCGLSKLWINCGNLKSLEISFFICKWEEIDIQAMNLASLVIDTVHCPHGFRFNTPKLTELRINHQGGQNFFPNHQWEFRMVNNQQLLRRNFMIGRGGYTKTAEILESCSGLYVKPRTSHNLHYDDEYTCSFNNLRRLFIKVNLKDVRQATIIAFFFRWCFCLQELNIEIDDGRMSESDHDCLPYPVSQFWERREYWISYSLRRVQMKGFRGHVLEIEFAKLLLTKISLLENMVIQLHDECSPKGEASTRGLLSLPMASTHVSIVIKSARNRLKAKAVQS
ncbi:PREDICTED: putative F-box/FBD/LRR-repeat protein At1g78760 [Nelumbo nucifera]|uniref:F-box domain-containing protein n=2 Tax=Nelumbo nucifera TaxID=4432 RepID=A0A822Z235_NELNU|nr:PREDICTED: putative F-box/FBD/LRR-repeat protein At1g78760 [Nelumbo nucifera]DAD37495.1 TPA_asm: hypothetical protein HUJ06_008136 [Nelumbo nucifera]